MFYFDDKLCVRLYGCKGTKNIPFVQVFTLFFRNFINFL